MSLRQSSLKRIFNFKFEFRIPNDASRPLLRLQTDGRPGAGESEATDAATAVLLWGKDRAR
jgi:hypothetical protein